MASRRPRLMGESSSGGDAASENRRELRADGTVSGQPPDPLRVWQGRWGEPQPLPRPSLPVDLVPVE